MVYKKMSALNSVLGQFYYGNGFEVRNANISKIISNTLAKIPLISRIQNGKHKITYSTSFF